MKLSEAKEVADNPHNYDSRDWERAKQTLKRTANVQTENSYRRLQRRLEALDNHIMNAKQSFIGDVFVGTD